jgi:hypothetical protein
VVAIRMKGQTMCQSRLAGDTFLLLLLLLSLAGGGWSKTWLLLGFGFRLTLQKLPRPLPFFKKKEACLQTHNHHLDLTHACFTA